MPTTYAALDAEARAELEALGFDVPPMPAAPAGCLVRPTGEVIDFPVDLDEVHDRDLDKWLGHLAAWIAYAKGLLGVVESVRTRAAAIAAARRAWVMAHSGAAKVTAQRLEADVDEDVVSARAAEEQAHAREKLIRGRMEGLVQQYQAISRRYGLRLAEAEQRRA
jgi:hypothetical protein